MSCWTPGRKWSSSSSCDSPCFGVVVLVGSHTFYYLYSFVYTFILVLKGKSPFPSYLPLFRVSLLLSSVFTESSWGGERGVKAGSSEKNGEAFLVESKRWQSVRTFQVFVYLSIFFTYLYTCPFLYFASV